MSARPLERHPIAVAAETAVDDAAGAAAVHGDPRIDARPAVAEQVLHTAEVAQPLLAHGADEQEIGRGADFGGAHGPQHRQDHHQPTRVVADARREERVTADSHRDVGALGKHGVQMRVHGHRALAPAAPKCQHVAHLVDPHRVGAGLTHHLGELGGAHFLHERRCGNLREHDEVGECRRFQFVDDAKRLLDVAPVAQVFDFALVGVGLCGHAGAEGDREDGGETCGVLEGSSHDDKLLVRG